MPLGSIDVAFYRDDIGLRPVLPEEVTDLPFDITGRVVVLVDDVLFTGRTVRAALEALAARGRAGAVQLAVMVDRGHRELPIRPDFVGKNLPTRRDERVEVTEQGVAIGDLVARRQGEGGPMSLDELLVDQPGPGGSAPAFDRRSRQGRDPRDHAPFRRLRRGLRAPHPEGAGAAGDARWRRSSWSRRPGPGSLSRRRRNASRPTR